MKKLLILTLTVIFTSCSLVPLKKVPTVTSNVRSNDYLSCYDYAYSINGNHLQAVEVCKNSVGERR